MLRARESVGFKETKRHRIGTTTRRNNLVKSIRPESVVRTIGQSKLSCVVQEIGKLEDLLDTHQITPQIEICPCRLVRRRALTHPHHIQSTSRSQDCENPFKKRRKVYANDCKPSRLDATANNQHQVEVNSGKDARETR